MLNPFRGINTRRNPFGVKVINRHELKTNDITGSLMGLKEPDRYYTSPNIRKAIQSGPINKNDIETDNITGSFENLEEPAKYIVAQNRPDTVGTKIVNEKQNTLDYNKQIIEYSSREIQKQITGFDASTNQLFISASIIDYGTEEVSSENFEILYNGATAPFIYKVEQVGPDVIITFSEEYVNYETLTNSQIFVLGKFK